MKKPRLLVLSLGGTITMVPSDSGGIAPKLGAAELVASVPALAEVGDIDAHSPFRLPSPSLTPANLVEVAGTIREAFASGCDGAVVIQGTDTIEESAFLLDLLVDSDKPVVVTGAMRGADAPGADGPANLLSAAIVAACPESRGLGALAVLNYDIHAARFVQKSHTALPSAFLSPLVGPIGTLIERQPRFYVRVTRNPTLPAAGGPPAPVALIKAAMGDDGRLFGSLPGLGYAGVVIEGMGAGHVHADVAPIVGDLATKMPVVLASRAMTGPVFTKTYGYPGAEIDLPFDDDRSVQGHPDRKFRRHVRRMVHQRHDEPGRLRTVHGGPRSQHRGDGDVRPRLRMDRHQEGPYGEVVPSRPSRPGAAALKIRDDVELLRADPRSAAGRGAPRAVRLADRVPLHQAWPLLVHAALFGGGDLGLVLRQPPHGKGSQPLILLRPDGLLEGVGEVEGA